MKKISFGIVAILLAMGTSFADAGGPDLPKPIVRKVSHTMKLSSAVNAINANGFFELLIKNSKRSQVRVSTTNFKPVKVYVSHHILFLKTLWKPYGLNKRPVVTVQIPNLKQLTVNSLVNVKSTRLQARGLTIEAHGSGQIQLAGMLKVNRIDQSGANHINLRWIKSNQLFVKSTGDGHIKLAGVARSLYARLDGHSVLNTRYLRTRFIHVQTKNHATASVDPLTSLRAFAFGNSNIYYYKIPKNITRSSSQSGNVLHIPKEL